VLFTNAVRFYLLLQHHTTIKRAEVDGLIRGTLPTCNSVITNLGPQVSLLCLDARGERTKYDICRPETYHRIFDCLYRMVPPTTRHLIVVTGVPVIYPRLTLFETAMGGIRDFNLATLVGKTGALGDIINGQLNNWNGDPELLDDMNDRKFELLIQIMMQLFNVLTLFAL
jgi:PhoD related phosphatase